jgi:AraC-like DNA-binding protein
MTVFAPGLSGLWSQIEASGLDPEPLFTRHGVDKQVIFDNSARVPLASVDAIMSDAIEQLDDPFFGARQAEYFRPAHLGPLGFAWLASANLSEGFKRVQRYVRVINEKLELDVVEEGATIIVSVEEHDRSLSPYHRDTGAVAVLVRMCRFIYGESWNPLGIRISHPAPADSSYFYTFFRCPIEFGADTNCIVLDRVQANQQIPGANEHLAQMNDHIVLKYLAHRSREDFVSRTRAAILDCLGDGNVTETMVAGMLHLSPRQLNRKLTEEDTNFTALLVESRRELAEQYIHDSSLSLTEISFMLGFSEASSFSRAYRRWTGKSPTQARGMAD